MSSEEELPNELDRLEIAPTLPQIKLMDSRIPLTLNPFYGGVGSKSSQHFEGKYGRYVPQKGFAHPASCRKCRLRRRSESVIDEFKEPETHRQEELLDPLFSCTVRSIPGVQKQPFKKLSSSVGTNRKILIREPVLQALQNCFHKNTVRRKLLADMGNESANTSEAILIEDTCQNLLDQDVTFTKNVNLPHQLSSCHLKLMSRTQAQAATTEIASNSKSNSSSKSTSDATSNSIRLQNASQQHSDSSIVSRASTSCSQQAGSSAAASAGGCCDDITINELASYFDTFVYIPKKMSSMAEMMYI